MEMQSVARQITGGVMVDFEVFTSGASYEKSVTEKLSSGGAYLPLKGTRLIHHD